MKIRASSLPELLDCPHRWESKNILGMRLPTSGAAQLGTAVHAGTAVFDQSRIVDAGLTAEDAAGAVVDAIWHPDQEVVWEDSSPREAEPIALALHRKYCAEISPQFTFTDVEAKCNQLEIADLGITLTGTTDRVFVSQDGFGIADLKTGRSVVSTDGTVKTAGHAAQIAVYELLAEASTGRAIDAPARIIGLQAAKTEAGRRAAIGEITGAKELLVGTEDQPGLLEIASEMIKSGRLYGNPRSSLCGKKWCPVYDSCRFRR